MFEAKARGVQETIIWIEDMGLHRITIECDSEMVVHALPKEEIYQLEVGHIIEESKEKLKTRSDLSVCHVRRKANMAAHLMAKLPYMVAEKNGIKKWKRVEVNLKDHVIVPILPKGMSPEFYEEYLYDYLSKLGMDPLPENRPLWEVHLFKYPTCTAAGSIIAKFHHSLGDGYSLLGALLSCLKRLDNPSIPLSFPSLHSSNSSKHGDYSIITSILERVPQVSSWIANTVLDFGASILKSSVIKDVESPIRSVHDGVQFQPMAFTTIEFSMDDIKIIKNRLKVTINDVITGIILLGSRLYMEGETMNSSRTNSNALVLINTRNLGGYKSVSEMVNPKANKLLWGNQFAFIHVPLPTLSTTNLSTPVNFVYETHKIIKRKRNNAAVLLTANYIHNTMRNSSITISNLIGPVEKTSMDNLPIRGLYFFVTGSPQSTQVTVISYAGKLRIGVGVEKDFIDPHKFKSCIANAFDLISEAAVGP
ncbi:wax ester synthase/diacylglycerol acyltransferase 5-like [Apium graveolens]|uniref:wax ester synthase/diacylglycerol acyltransferase 5-like n=1 Tax=Apium graveolens TaxID=4045 RepID=UPI003D7A44EC